MTFRNTIAAIIFFTFAVSCGQQADNSVAKTENAAGESEVIEDAAVSDTMQVDVIEIAPGLTARVLRSGDGRVAQAGDNVVVHYTGWLFDETADNKRGTKFDSSVDRGEHFQFPLGAGRVIKGWDQGVAGMAIGELRELTIAPDMGYGNRGAGNLIPPGATLVFEVELFDLQSLGAPATN